MSATVEAPAPPHALKVVRLRPGYGPAWLAEYRPILRRAAEDFLRRARLPGTPEGVLGLLEQAARMEDGGVWLLLTPDYRLRGWAVAALGEPLGGPRLAEVVAMHIYPRGTPPGAFRALVAAIRAWATEAGATEIVFQSRRGVRGLWARQVEAEPVAVLYRAPVTPTSGPRPAEAAPTTASSAEEG
jgi:GNAT superfamily N-acetyltransferase